MNGQRESASPSDTVCSLSSPFSDSYHDPHSSEEELEVINSNSYKNSIMYPETGMWSQIHEQNIEKLGSQLSLSNDQIIARSHSFPDDNDDVQAFDYKQNLKTPYSSSLDENCFLNEHFSVRATATSTSDDDIPYSMASMAATPVQFRTTAPVEALKPETSRRATTLSTSSHLSPRRRSRHRKHLNVVQRPYLDFEKMQQVI